MISEEEKSFYLNGFSLHSDEIDLFNIVLSKLMEVFPEHFPDRKDPFNKESLIKASILCVKVYNNQLSFANVSQFQDFLQKFASYTKCDLNLNFKNVNRLINLLKNIKTLVSNNKVKHEELIIPTYQYIEQYSQSKNYHRKLNQIFGMFLVDTQHTFKVKQLIWAVFIYLRCKLLKLSTNFLEKLHLLFKVFTVIINKVPLMYFPSSLGITALNKFETIKSKLSEKTQTNIQNVDYEPIIQSLPPDLEFNEDKIDINAITIHIERFYSLYANEYLDHDIMFDERVLLTDLFKTDSSPVKMSVFSHMKDNLKCAKCLFSEPQIGVKSISSNDGNPFKMLTDNTISQTPIDMTPCTRAVLLDKWVKTYISNFDGKHVLQLQDKYIPKYEYNPAIKPLDIYIKSQFQIFEKQLHVYKFRIITSFPEIQKMCLKLINLLFQKDLMIFTEEFCAMLLYNEDFIKAMIAISIEIILFVEDIQEISFHKIPELLGVDIYDLWKVLKPTRFQSFTFHKEIKEHLDEIEYQIVSFLIWRKPSMKFITDIKHFFQCEQNDNDPLNILADFEYETQSLFLLHRKEDYELNYQSQKTPPNMDIYKDIRHLLHNYKHLQGISVFFRRVINYSNLLNKNIFINLKHPKTSTLAEISEQFIKHIITNETYVETLYNKHIDQIIICSIISILLINNLFSFETSPKINNDFINIFTLQKLQDIYIRSKPRQIRQVSETIFEKVKVSDKKYSSLMDFYNANFKILFQEHLIKIKQDNCEGEELNEMPAVKKRKFSDSSIFCNKNTNQEALQNKSAFGNKIDNYMLFEKKNILNEQFGFKNPFYGSYVNEFKSKRTQLLKELYSYLVKIDLDLSMNKQENPALRKLLVGLDRSGKKFNSSFGQINNTTNNIKLNFEMTSSNIGSNSNSNK